MKMNKNVSQTIIEELGRYNQINKYITEQEDPTNPEAGVTPPDMETPAPPPSDATLGGATPPPSEPGSGPGQAVDIANDPDVEELTGDDTSTEPTTEPTTNEDSGTEELDITELVKSQKNVETKQEEYMTSMMSKLDDLEQKLSQMDSIFEKINSLENKIEKYRTKTPEERLELRSLDSYPFNQKLTDFFGEKSQEMEKSGKNEYVLTPDDVEDVDHRQIRKTFDQGLSD